MPLRVLSRLLRDKILRNAAAIVALSISISAIPAMAQTSASIELKSDDRYRGRSLSGGQPVIETSASLDTKSGVYLGTSATLTLTGEGRAGFQAAEFYVGYTESLGDEARFDVGVIGYVFSERYSGNRPDQFGEIFVGFHARNITVYVHYTPNYLDQNVPALYTSASTAVPLGNDLTLAVRGGVLTQTSGPPRLGGKSWRYDTSLSISRPVFGVDAEIAMTFAGPNDAYFAGPWDGRSAIVFSVAKHF